MAWRGSGAGRRLLISSVFACAACVLLVFVLPVGVRPGAATQDGSTTLPDEIRVGLATDLSQLEVACCDGLSWLVDEAGRRYAVTGSFRVQPAPGAANPGTYRLQVAALKDAGQAEALAERLSGLLGQTAEAVLDAATGLYRVRVGRFADRASAAQARDRLQLHGFDDVWIAVEGRVLKRPGLAVDGIGRVAGRRLRLESEGGTVAILERRYRGALEIFLTDRAGLNVVNAVPLEGYLRGVVPVELGPALYPELEAIKAQAVAARTYAVRRLGEFEAEGFDLCATPLCQVYGGLEAEHPVSDQAVAATRGEIAHRGHVPLEALFTASCGGSTEQVDHVFPRLAADRLVGTACVEGGALTLRGGADGPPGLHLLRSLGERRRAGPRLAERLDRARAKGELESVAGNLGGLAGGWLDLRVKGRRRLFQLGAEDSLLVAEAAPGSSAADDMGVAVGSLAAAPGDRLRVHAVGGRAVLVVHEAPDGELEPPAAPWSVWRSRASLQAAVERRWPGLDLQALRVLERGASGRVARLRLVGRRSTVTLHGLEIRWFLEVPEHVVDLRPEVGQGGAPGWRLRGRGRGHGVGMCQIGAFLMAKRGLTYREILRHYYGDVEIARPS